MTEVKGRPEDINVICGGQGGDGSLTVINILADVLRSCGMKVYTERDVRSRIKGGITSATLRAFVGDRLCIGSDVDLLVAFDTLAVKLYSYRLNSNSVVIYDNSAGDLTDDMGLPEGVRLIGVPLSRCAVKSFRRDIYKNSIAFAVVGRLFGLDDAEMKTSFEKRFARRGAQLLKYNLEALEIGCGLADEAGLTVNDGRYAFETAESKRQMLITGNEATALGFAVAGGRFFAGYPITPSTEVMEWLIKWLPKFGGVVRQAEDELSAVNMALGASLAGARSMTATCGPGVSLMQEGIGQLGMCEIPLVIVDAQRGGPSTGLPTKPEQSDINLLVYGGHGDFPRAVLAPGTPQECFEISVAATNLSEQYQLPVFIALDQAISQNLASVEPFEIDKVEIDRGKRLSETDLSEKEEYRRYAFTKDGVSEYSIPGTPGGMWLVQGAEHDEWGLVSTDPLNRTDMVQKRLRKMESMKKDLPKAVTHGVETAEIGFIGVGATYGIIREAMDILESKGIFTQYHQPRTLFPMLDETPAFTERCKKIFVVEYNATGQIANLIKSHGGNEEHLISYLQFDGTPMKAKKLADFVLEKLNLKKAEVA